MKTYIRQIRPFSEAFKNIWGGIRPFMVPGWRTWIDQGENPISYHPEHNKYGINFKPEDFEIMDEDIFMETLKSL